MTVLCAPGDMWFSDAAFCEMEQEVPSVQVCCVCACLHLLRLICLSHHVAFSFKSRGCASSVISAG